MQRREFTKNSATGSVCALAGAIAANELKAAETKKRVRRKNYSP